MKGHGVLYALGRDRIGVADDLATTLAARGIDIEQSRMTALGGRFALILKLHGETDRLEALRNELRQLAATLGFDLRLESVEPARAEREATRFRIECFSERPAEIGAVTGLLKRLGINIEDLETDGSAAAWTSAITFHLRARIKVPASCPVATLRKELREFERGRQLDILLEPVLLHAVESPVPAGSA